MKEFLIVILFLSGIGCTSLLIWIFIKSKGEAFDWGVTDKPPQPPPRKNKYEL